DNTDTVDPAAVQLHEVANIGEPQVMAIGGAIGQVFEADGLWVIIAGTLPGAGRAVELAIEGHRAPHRALTRGRLRVLLCQYPVDPKASGTWILALDVQDLLEQREGELIVWMLWRPRPLVL